MKIRTETVKAYAQNVMDRKQLSDFNAWAGTDYDLISEMLESVTNEQLVEFFDS